MAPTKLKRLPRLPGGKRKGLPQLKGADPKLAEREPAELQRIVNALGDGSDALRIAKRVMVLKAQHPAASLPELVTYHWLESRNIPFTFQAMLFGGRRTKGGLVPDFVVQWGGKGMAWQVQGEYWHRYQSAHGQKDVSVKLRLLGAIYRGVRIDYVVELWEKDILRKRPQVFSQALQGVGLRD